METLFWKLPQMIFYIIYQTRVQVLDRGFQTLRNRWKLKTVEQVLLLFWGVWKSRSNATHKFLIWLIKLFHFFSYQVVLFQCFNSPWEYSFKNEIKIKCGNFVVRYKSCGSEDDRVFCSEKLNPFSFSKNRGRIKVAAREHF